MLDFFARFADDESCLRHIFEVRWGSHAPCPRCHRFGRWFPLRGSRKYQHSCRKQVSVLEGTVLYRSNVALLAWFYAMLLISNSSAGIRASFLRKQLGLGVKSSVRVAARIRLQMAAYDRPDRLGGPGKKVYVDEALLRYVMAGRFGEGWAEPTIVMGFACDKKVISGIIPDRKRSTILPIIERIIRPGSIIVTDGHSSYKQLGRLGWEHITVNHSVFFSDFKGNTLNDIETYWRVLKRALSSSRMVYAHNLWLYLAEVEFRYNCRKSTRSAFEHLIGSFPAIDASAEAALQAKFDWRPRASIPA